MRRPRAVVFFGRSRRDLESFPSLAQEEAIIQLRRVQEGLPPQDGKPIASIGTGVAEIRIRDATGAFRVIYVAKLKDAIYVLHCFQKKSQKTSRADIELATKRYKQVIRGAHHL